MNEPPEDLACRYVLDQLDQRERAACEERLLREPGFAALVNELEAGLARGVRTLPPHEPPAGLLARIEARLDALPAPASRPVPWAAIARWGLAAMVTVSLATLAVQSLRRTAAQPVIVLVGLDQNRSTFAELPLPPAARDPDTRFIQLAALAENYWKKPGELPLKPEAGTNRGYALFDPGSRQGFIAIERLPVVAETQRYHLWILDPATTRVHDAGILPLGGMSRGLYSFALGSDDSPPTTRPDFFITVEEKGAPQPARPQGRVVLGQQRL